MEKIEVIKIELSEKLNKMTSFERAGFLSFALGYNHRNQIFLEALLGTLEKYHEDRPPAK